MPFNFMYSSPGLFGRMGMGYQQQQNPFAQRQMPQMGMPQMRAQPMGMSQMGMPLYMPPYLAQYMQQYGMPQGMQGMGQNMPQGMPQYPMQQQGMHMGMGAARGGIPQPVSNEYAGLIANRAAGNFPVQGDTFQGRRGTIMPQQPMPQPMGQPMGMGARPTGAMPPPSADLQAAIAQLTAGRNSGTLPQGDTFQNNRNRQPTTLQGTFNSLRALGAKR